MTNNLVRNKKRICRTMVRAEILSARVCDMKLTSGKTNICDSLIHFDRNSYCYTSGAHIAFSLLPQAFFGKRTINSSTTGWLLSVKKLSFELLMFFSVKWEKTV